MQRVVASITPQNVDQMEAITEIALEAGATNVVFGPIAPIGRAKNHPELIISTDENSFRQFSHNMEYLESKYGNFIALAEEEALARDLNCGAGSKGLTITPTGAVKLCQMADSDLLCFRNVYDKSFHEILKNKRNLIKELSQLPSPKESECNDCEDLWFCTHCLARGLIKAASKKEECRWYQNHIVSKNLEKYLFNSRQ